MKLKFALLVGFLLSLFQVTACDLCSIYMNIEPNDLQNSIGFNYRYRLFENQNTRYYTLNSGNKHALGNTVLSEVNSQIESYNSYDLWANYFISQKWQISANMTFADNYYSENDSILYNVAGPGDLSILLKHMIFNSKVTDSSNFAIRLLAGGGIKLPLGSFNKTYTVVPSKSANGNVVYGSPYKEVDPHFQPGTGSIDFIAVTELLVRYKGIGATTTLSYRWNTENSNQFRFANRLNSSSSVFYLWKLTDKFAITPNVGLTYEFSKRDQLKGEDYPNSGGSALFTTLGTKLYISKFAFGFTYFKPIKQQLNDNQLPNENRMTGDLTFYF